MLLRRISRDTVDAGRPSRRAISRSGSSCASPTEISSRSASDRYRPDPADGPFPSGAPAAGGGGTAGLQDPLLLELGGAAVLVGAGSLLYRRKLIRKR